MKQFILKALTTHFKDFYQKDMNPLTNNKRSLTSRNSSAVYAIIMNQLIRIQRLPTRGVTVHYSKNVIHIIIRGWGSHIGSF